MTEVTPDTPEESEGIVVTEEETHDEKKYGVQPAPEKGQNVEDDDEDDEGDENGSGVRR